MQFTGAQLEAWIASYLWPFVRIGACFMAVPLFSASAVPVRLRVVIAGALTVLVAPLVPAPPQIPLLSAAGAVVLAQQVVIGVVLGFVLQITFDALVMGGQLLGNTMGLSFAFNVDPLHGAGTPVLGQFYSLVATLTFVALDGHLAIVQVLVDGFSTLPVGTSGLGSEGLWQVAIWGSQLFRGALMVALPGLAALLVVNLAFGVVSRAAPTLNLFAIGFPFTLMAGLVIVVAGLPAVQSGFLSLVREGFALMAQLVGGTG